MVTSVCLGVEGLGSLCWYGSHASLAQWFSVEFEEHKGGVGVCNSWQNLIGGDSTVIYKSILLLIWA